MSNCVSCGKYSAESNMICPNCHTKANKAYADLEQDFKSAHEEIWRLRLEIARLEASDSSKEQSSLEYYRLYRKLKEENRELYADINKMQHEFEQLEERGNEGFDKLKAENKALKERLNVQELTVNEFIEELAWRDVQWAAEASGMSSEACGQPSRGAISTYRKSYDKFYEECKQFAEARLKELKEDK